MKLKKLLAAVTTGVLAVTSLSLSGLVSSAEVQELMNDTFESGYGAWKGVGSSLSLSTEQSHSGGTSLYCYDRTASWLMMLEEESDEEMRELAKEELNESKARVEEL